jgi:hypothetical protein
LVLGLTAAACGGRPAGPPQPESPNAAMAQFLAAVKAKNLQQMGTLWGSERGPAVAWWKDKEALNKRLTVMQIYLQHDSYRVIEGPMPVPGKSRERTFRVELTRQQCVNVVPFEVVRTKQGGWLVVNAPVDAAGRPVGSCAAPGTGR